MYLKVSKISKRFTHFYDSRMLKGYYKKNYFLVFNMLFV